MARTERYAIEEVINAIRKGHTALGAAHILGCTPKAVRNYAKKFPKVADALRQERISLRDLGEMSLRGAIARGEGWAVMGVFKTIDEDGNFIPPNKVGVEHSGEIQTKHIFDHTAVAASVATGSGRYRDPSGADESGGDGATVG